MAITGRPRPLPECVNPECRAPIPRAVWRVRRTCRTCATPAELMAATHRAHELAHAATATIRTTDARIERLAARRAARQTPGAQP